MSSSEERKTSSSSLEEEAPTNGAINNGRSRSSKRIFNPLNPLKRNPPPVPITRNASRESQASWLSKLVFQWVQPLMSIGYKRPLEFNDLGLVDPNRSCGLLAIKVQAAFEKRCQDTGSKRALLWALYDTFRFEFLMGGLCHFLQTVFQIVRLFLLRYIISFAHRAWNAAHQPDQSDPPICHGIGIIVGFIVLGVARLFCSSHFQYYGMVVGGQSRAVLMTLLYDKTLKLSARARAGVQVDVDGNLQEKRSASSDPSGDSGYTNGRIINIMSTDTHRIDQALGMFHMLWCAPFSIIFTLILLIVNLNYSALPGFGILVFAFAILSRIARRLLRRRIAINKLTDERVSLVYEVLQAIRVVKLFSWEASFLSRIDLLRKHEISSLRILSGSRNAINAAALAIPLFASIASFVVFFTTKHPLDPALVFSSLALFSGLRLPLSLLPGVLSQVIDAYSSLCRIQTLLVAEEAVDEFDWNFDAQYALEVKNGNFTWEQTLSDGKAKPDREQASLSEKEAVRNHTTQKHQQFPFQLDEINLAVGRRELVAVIGVVGSGKSALLAALAGEMRATGKPETATIGATRAFCSQYAWIQNATLRDNITFSTPWDQARYDRVLDACALRADLSILPDHDMTEIGERGITLSGGQKQRLNIARAIYSGADLVLLDDPLSAVDAHVGRHIMDHAIGHNGMLSGKARVLVTHQLNVIQQCDRIVWMENGRIIANDTFASLLDNNEEFRKLMVSSKTSSENSKGNASLVSPELHSSHQAAPESSAALAKPRKTAGLMTAEERAQHAISWGVYLAYLRAAGGFWVAPLLISILIVAQVATIMSGLALAFWTSHKWNLPMGTYLGVYSGLGAGGAIATFAFSFGLSAFGTRASKNLLQNGMDNVMSMPMSFFDTTPLGRITNRFSKDVDVLDNSLTENMRAFFSTIGLLFGAFILTTAYLPYFAFALAFVIVASYFITDFFRASARDIKRLESLQRSFVFAKFGEAVVGVSTIRAYGCQHQFLASIQQAIDEMNNAYFLSFASQGWLGIRLDMLANIVCLVAYMLTFAYRKVLHPSIIGLLLSYLLSVVELIQLGSRQMAEVDNDMNSAERLHYYAGQLEQEPITVLPSMRVDESWPATGAITFHGVQMRYRSGLPLVLNGLTISIRGGERVGIVGRTGAGKSSILNALFRMTELSSGSICIDGVDISRIGLHDLRSRLAIIPQDPTLFRGTIRSNLDPFDSHTDLELWSALRQVGLGASDAGTRGLELESPVEEEGLNFSLGQRQLVALARAVVRDSRIIVCDEATSSVDFEMDQRIQKTILQSFKGKTLICIAHRLRTILQYDRIVVMDEGRIAETDTPLVLFEARGSIFRGMCERSGIGREDFE